MTCCGLKVAGKSRDLSTHTRRQQLCDKKHCADVQPAVITIVSFIIIIISVIFVQQVSVQTLVNTVGLYNYDNESESVAGTVRVGECS